MRVPADAVRPALPVEQPLDWADGQWWWEVALDGIVGAVLTGVIAAGAVVLTIRHERGQATKAVEEERIRAAEAELRRAVARARSVAVAGIVEISVMADDAGVEDRIKWTMTLFEALVSAAAEARTVSPSLQNDLTILGNAITYSLGTKPYDRENAGDIATEAAQRTQDWLTDPESFEAKPRVGEDDFVSPNQVDLDAL